MSRKFLWNLGAAVVGGLTLLLAQGSATSAAEVRVFASSGFGGALNALGQSFERASGHRVIAVYDVFAVLKRKIDMGEAFDVAILSPALISELEKEAKIVGSTRSDIARTGMGAAVRKGEPKPAIGTVEEFKQALLKAKSVSFAAEGASGAHFLSVLGRLSIAEEMKPKLRPSAGGGAAPAVAKGEVELVVTGVSAIVPVSGIDLIGWLPQELQSYIVFTGGVSSATKEAEAAKALMSFLAAPEANSVLKEKGMERIAR